MSLEQLSNAITAYAFFTEDGVGDTGLTVTVDVYEGTTAGPIVTAANATELAGGFYYYTLASGSVDAVGAYLFLFKTTNADTDQKQIAAGWMIGTMGMENLDAPLSTIDTVVDSILEDTGTTLDGKINTIDDFLDTEVAAILADTNELQTDLVNGGRLDLLIDAIKAKTDNLPASPAAVGSAMTLADDAITSAKFDESTAFPLKSADTGATAVARTGADSDTLETLSDQLDLTATQASVNTIDDFLDTEIAAILADTNELQTDLVNGGRLDLLIDGIKAKTDLIPAAPAATGDIPSAATIADAVWDEATSGHTTAGSASKAVIDILEDTATTIPASITVIDDFLDTEIAAILADTNELQTDFTNGGRLDLLIDAILEDTGTTIPASITIIDDFLDTEVAAILADTNELQTDLVNGGRLDLLIDGIKAVTDKLDTSVELDGAVYRFTTNALEQAPTGGSAPSAADIADAVLDEAMSGHVGAGTLGKAVADILEDTATTIPGTITTLTSKVDTIDDFLDTEVAAILADTNELQTDWTNGGRLDLIVDAILDDTATTLPGTLTTIIGKVDAVDDYVDTEVAAIKVVTDKLGTAVELDGAVYRFTTNALEQAPTGGSAPTAADIADAVLDEAMSGHTTAGTLGKAVADILEDTATTIPGTLSTIAGYIDTEVAAIKAKTDNLPSDPADQSAIEAAITAATSPLATAANLATVDTVVDAIKLKTDLIPAAPAAVGDIPTTSAIADQVWDEATSGHSTTGSTGKALIDIAAGGSAPTAAAIADAVWDELTADHAIVGSTGKALSSAGAAADPWLAELDESYAVGTAGYTLNDINNKLDTTAATVAASLTGTTLNVRRGDTFTVQFSSLGSLAGYTKIWFTLKRNPSQDDADSEIQVVTSAGLLYINGATAATAAHGSITVNNPTSGTITVVVDEAETSKLGLRDNCYYDVQMLLSGNVTTLTQGRANIIYDITRAVI